MPDLNVGADELPASIAASIAPVEEGEFDGLPDLPEGASLADAQEALDRHASGESSEEGREEVREPLEPTEPVHDLPDDDVEPAPAEESDEARVPESDPAREDVPAPAPAAEDRADDLDLAEETGKVGWPKPKYSDDDLKDNPQAQEERRHWKAVFRTERSEHKQAQQQHEERYGDIDPDEARKNKASLDQLFDDPEYAAAATLLRDPNSASSQIAAAFLDPNHPSHADVMRRWQSAGQPQGDPSPRDADAIAREAYDAETGEFDQGKYRQLMNDRDRAIAQAIQQQFQQQARPAGAPPHPAPEQDQGQRLLETFCEARGLPVGTTQIAFKAALDRASINGEDVEPNMQGLNRLYEIVKEMRKEVLGASDTRARQDEVARHKRATNPRPRTASQDRGAPNLEGKSLSDIVALRDAGEIEINEDRWR